MRLKRSASRVKASAFVASSFLTISNCPVNAFEVENSVTLPVVALGVASPAPGNSTMVVEMPFK